MNVGLFLDVDNTLTRGFIQAAYAEVLGCEDEYSRLEEDFQRGSTDAAEFGVRIIELFAERGFTEATASEHFRDIPLQGWTEELLRLPVAIYLVSSGPNYFINRLAAEYSIPNDRVLCSEYLFEGQGGVISSCRSVSEFTKAQFVQGRQAAHAVSIGVGDSVEKDGPFISQCSIPIITAQNSAYFSIGSFETLCNTARNISRSLGPNPNPEPQVFIGSSVEALGLAEQLQALMDRYCQPTIWTQGVFQPSRHSMEDLEEALEKYDFAVLFVSPDDVTWTRGVEQPSARDNVILELGLFVGKLGRRRCFIVQPRDEDVRLPSDLLGIAGISYASNRPDANLAAALGPVATTLQTQIERLGPIRRFGR